MDYLTTGQPTSFNFESYDIRTVMVDNEPWFVAKDVCEVLGISNSNDAIASLEDDELVSVKPISGGQRREMKAVSESGLYALIFKSRKPGAKRFSKWVTSEVLPMIRKSNGVYVSAQKAEEILSNPDTIISLARQVKDYQTNTLKLQRQIEADKPKVIFADAVGASQNSILIGDLAKFLRQNGIEIGQNRLFEWLRNNGWLMKEGESRNMPTQKGMERRYFEVQERTIYNSDGSIRTTRTPKVTGKGQVYFIAAFLNRDALNDAEAKHCFQTISAMLDTEEGVTR